jgi:CHASE2 domain-containing sensor protein
MEYSGAIEFLLFVVWAVGSLLLAWFVRRLFYVYFGSVALSAPMIGYSMVGYGLLPMGGIIHGFCAGIFVLPFYFLFQRFRTRKTETR